MHADPAIQERLLPRVSRTFALTIPTLPRPLSTAVANAYLLCRIADTIEDDPRLPPAHKERFARRFAEVVEGRASPEGFALELAPALDPDTPQAERELVARTPEVVLLTHALPPATQAALARCVRVMATGMAEFQRIASPRGLPDLAALDRYCYVVAGVVGEMLTELFCAHSPEVRQRRAALLGLAPSFGQGLQLTNILKDLWTDLARGVCWLPRDRFAAHGCDLSAIEPGRRDPAFHAALGEMLSLAHGHLRDALAYSLLLPRGERGMRRFCLWPVAMALRTLRRIDRRRDFRDAREVRISRREVRVTAFLTSTFASRDGVLRLLFRLAGRGLPPPGGLRDPVAGGAS